MELIELFIIFGLGYFVGKAHGYYKMASAIRELLEDMDIDIEKDLLGKTEETTQSVHKLEVETVNETLYLYDKETRDFICQGNTVQELAKLAKDYKNITLAAVMHGEKVFTFTDGESKEFTA